VRYRRLRRLLGPFEPQVRDGYHWVRGRIARWRRSALVVVALDGDHDGPAQALPEDLDDRIGVWLCCRDDVAPLGSSGWFVVRLEPASVRHEDDRQAEVAAVVASWRRACRDVVVVDLSDDPGLPDESTAPHGPR